MYRKPYRIIKASEYKIWFEEQTAKSKLQIDGRTFKIEYEGYFGDHKFLSDDIWELRWLNGRRVYYAEIKKMSIILLLGGNKNGQDKDITKAKKILKKNVSLGS